MEETDGDLVRLQVVLDESAERSGGHLRSAFAQERRPSARELVEALPGFIESRRMYAKA